MPLYKATAAGQVEMTQEEETAFNADQATFVSVSAKRARLRARINEEKKKAETAGVNVGNVIYSTDFSSRLELSNAYIYLVRNPEATINLEAKNGDVVELDITELEAVYDGVNNYTASVATARKSHFDAIKLLTSENIDAYDPTTLWP